jgi:glycosyltransferase involved in cell wall biosynthesis
MSNLISVIMPTKSSGATFNCAMASLQKQTYQNFEVIVIDDNSDCTSGAYLAPYSDVYRTRIVKSGRPEGKGNYIGELLNLGVRVSSGSIIARMDADDFWVPTHLETQLRILQEKNLDLVGSQSIDIDTQGNFISSSTLPLSKKQILSYAKWENPFVHSSVLFTRKSFVEIGGYSESMSSGQDYELWLRYLIAEKRVANNFKMTVFCLKSKESISAKTNSEQKNRDMAGLEGMKDQLFSTDEGPQRLIQIRRAYGSRRSLTFYKLMRTICISPRINFEIFVNQIRGLITFWVHKKIFRLCLQKRYNV